MSSHDELAELRRKIQRDPGNKTLIAKFRVLLDRLEGTTPCCPRCELNTHMIRGRVTTKNYYTWSEAGQSALERELAHKVALHLVGWRCEICNIVMLSTVHRKDQTLDWVANEELDPFSGLE